MIKQNKMSINAVQAKIEWEGLGDCIQNYMSGDSIEDQRLAEMWDACSDLMDRIEAYVAEHADPEEEIAELDDFEVDEEAEDE